MFGLKALVRFPVKISKKLKKKLTKNKKNKSNTTENVQSLNKEEILKRNTEILEKLEQGTGLFANRLKQIIEAEHKVTNVKRANINDEGYGSDYDDQPDEHEQEVLSAATRINSKPKLDIPYTNEGHPDLERIYLNNNKTIFEWADKERAGTGNFNDAFKGYEELAPIILDEVERIIGLDDIYEERALDCPVPAKPLRTYEWNGKNENIPVVQQPRETETQSVSIMLGEENTPARHEQVELGQHANINLDDPALTRSAMQRTEEINKRLQQIDSDRAMALQAQNDEITMAAINHIRENLDWKIAMQEQIKEIRSAQHEMMNNTIPKKSNMIPETARYQSTLVPQRQPKASIARRPENNLIPQMTTSCYGLSSVSVDIKSEIPRKRSISNLRYPHISSQTIEELNKTCINLKETGIPLPEVSKYKIAREKFNQGIPKIPSSIYIPRINKSAVHEQTI